MIDANELRLGNLISKDSDYIEVNDINQFGNDGKPKINGWDEEDFAPISLMPEWLERCGEKCDRQDWQYQIQVGALKWYFRWNTEWYSELGGIYFDSRFQYVHQVQNLYFLLIRQELTIKSFN